MKDSIFDLDRTLFSCNVSFSFYFYMLRERIVSRATLLRVIPLYFRCLFGSLGLESLHREVFRRVLKGLSFECLDAAAIRFLAESERMARPSMLRALELAKKSGAKTFLLSSSPAFLVSKIAERFAFDRFAGTQYAVDNEGKICEISSLITGPKKREIANEWIDRPENATAYTDSFDDLPLLEWVGEPVAVFPDRRLMKHAQRMNWRIERR